MNVSLNWLKEYIDINMEPNELGEVLTSLGLEVEGMEEVETTPGGLKGLVIGEVIECGRHPNADRLSLTKVDTGDGQLKQIVCGAPNVAKGQKVVVATVNTTLYPISGEPFKIKKGKIRGEVSEGMICAEDEIGIGQDHTGIIVLPVDVEVGIPASEYYDLKSDIVFDIGLTPNRSDATSHLGVARDLAAYLKVNTDHTGEVKYPDISGLRISSHEKTIPVRVDTYEGCPRFSGVTITNIEIKESPDWVKNRLIAIGVRPINNVVDITNYVLHEYGQPLHAYDLREIKGGEIVVKTLPEGSAFTTLDESERKLRAQDLMVCDGNENPMCIAGVFGGVDSGVRDDTKEIFLEGAHWNPTWIRLTSTHHNLRTDAAKCFEKGADPNRTLDAIRRAAYLMQEYAEATIASNFVDIYPEKILPKEVKVDVRHIQKLIGNDIDRGTIEKIFDALGMEIAEKDDHSYVVKVPTDKADVTREADVIEEILRIYGFNNVIIGNKLSTTIVPTQHPARHQFRNQLAEFLVGKGFNEMMGLSLVQSAYYPKESWIDPTDLVYINNTSNIQLDIMRPEMLMSGLDSVRYNMNRQQQDLRLFEFGNSYLKADDGYKEQEHLCLYMTGSEEGESWLSKINPVSFYSIKKAVHEILLKVDIHQYQVEEISGQGFDYGLRYYQGSRDIVRFGTVAKNTLKQMEVKYTVFAADINMDILYRKRRKQSTSVQEISKYPSMRRDLSLTMDETITFDQLKRVVLKAEKKLIKEMNLFDVYKNEKQLGKGKKSYAISLIYEDRKKTLNDKQVDKSIQNILTALSSQLDCTVR